MLAKKLDAILATCAGICVSLSHDCYIQVIGGTQIFITDEQKKFARQDYAYVHISARKPRLDFAPSDLKFEVQIVVNGEYTGIAVFQVLIEMLQERLQQDMRSKFLIIHSVLGFDEQQICELHTAIAPKRSVFWLHDYTSICEGFNLLRNDLEFCDAPPVDSQVCRICVYGATRARHLERMRWMFERCKFDVLSPSQFTLDFWQAKAHLPSVSAEAHPHWKLEAEPVARRRLSKAALAQPVRIGFVGYPQANKGWYLFSNLVEQFSTDQRYEFVHFAARGVAHMPECQFVVTEVTSQNRLAASQMLRDHKIDFLAMLSPWPETFSFVAHEGMAAGSLLLCLSDSGNVAALVRNSGRGFIFQDAAELENFLHSAKAVEAARAARRNHQTFKVINSGTTSTVTSLLEGKLP